MLSKAKAVSPKSLFYKNLHGGGRKRHFLQVFSLLILFIIPLTSSYSQNLKSSPDSIPFAPAGSYAVGVAPYSIFSGDLDGDGDLDLVTANASSQNVSILKNNGNGTFQDTVNYFVGVTGGYPYRVFCADLDRDGDLDLAVTDLWSDYVSILKNKGDGTFDLDSNYEIGYTPIAVFCADLDGDSDLDLAVAIFISNHVSILKNYGDGTFYLDGNYAVGNLPYSVFCADLDGDGDLDLAVANDSSDNVSILKNRGDGTFEPHVDYATGDGSASVFCSDLDGDGDLDLAVANPYSDNVSILKNNGHGTFHLDSNYAVGSGPLSVFCVDLDGDGDMDLAVANTWSNNVSILKNNGDGRFTSSVNYVAGTTPGSVFCADLDGDLDFDLAVANTHSTIDSVSILKNLTQIPANQPPWAFSLISPADQDTSFIVVQFHWANAYDPNFGDQIRYDLFISTSSQFHPDSTTIQNNLVKSQHRDTLDVGTYYWKVKAKDNWGAETWSTQTWSFVTSTELIKDFTAEPTHGRKPLNVAFQSFINATPDSVTWYFSDGDFSYLLNPVHQYTQVGSYDVKLVAEISGYKDSLIKDDYIWISDIQAKFSTSKRCGSRPLTVTFSDSSTSTYPIIAWHWDFGDGDTSNQQNPTHQYTSNGVFDVRLIASDSIGADTLFKQDHITTQDSVSTDFFGLPNSGRSPLTVMFESILSGIANHYFWDFGDGDTSTLRNPIHTYTSQGKYNVKLIVRLELDDCNQVDSMIKEEYVIINDLESRFSASSTAGARPLMVQFTDSSSGSPNSWFWNFGDGHTSTAPNPSYQYDTAGVYDVFLRVCNFIGCDSLLKMNYIRVDTPYADLFGEIYGYGFFGSRPGFDFGFYCVWTNVGTIPAENCTLKILFPSQMTFYDIVAVYVRTGTYSGYTRSGDTIIVPLQTIDPSGWYGGYVYAYGNIPASVPIGTTLVCQTWLTSSTPDRNYENNYVLHHQTVVGSWDPNDKLASPEGEGTSHTIGPDQRLAYTIQFENKPEATAEAIYIRVVDTLDYDLDWGSLAIGASSHPDKCHYEFDPYTGVIVWSCDSIMLPPNTNPPEGEGYFTFSISPKQNLAEGTEIANSALIRFDYNPWLQAPEEGPVIRTIKYPFIRGDVNGSGVIELGDVVYLISYLYKNGPAPNPLLAGDANCSGEVELGDVVYLITYLYKGGPPPPC